MKCEQCKARGWDHDQIVENCRKSIWWVAVAICGFERVAASRLHKVILRWLQEKLERGDKFILLMLPRDFLKTTMLASLTVWWWINSAELRVLLTHASGKMSAKLVPVVQRIIQSDACKHFFPELVPDTGKVTWNNDEMTIPRRGNYAQASLEARGISSTVTGGHYDKQLLDDPVDETVARSPVEIQRTIDWFGNSQYLFDSPKTQQMVVAGTWWEGGFYEHLLSAGLFTTLIFGAEHDERFTKFQKDMGEEFPLPQERLDLARSLGLDSGAVWPEFFDEETLALRKRQDPIKYARQKLNRPATDEELRFKKDDIKFYNWGDEDTVIVGEEKIKMTDLLLTATCDPATGESLKTDESAINVSGFHPRKGIVVVLESWHGRVLPDKLIEKLFDTHEKWKSRGLRFIGIEEVAFQSVLKHWFKQEQMKRGIYVNVKPLKVGNRSKAERMLDALQPFISNQQVYFLRNQGSLINELVNLRIVNGRIIGKSPNEADALAMQGQFWRIHTQEQDEESSEPVYVAPKRGPSYGLKCEVN